MLRFLAAFTLGLCSAVAAAAPPAAVTPAAGTPAAGTPAAGTPAAESQAADPRVALLKLLPAGSKLEDLRPSPIPGIYQFMQGADVSYLTADGKYFLDGNVYDMDSRENLTEELRTHARVAMINAVPESQMLIFAPKNPQYTITVFTDVDCDYCRKLHSEMAELNRLGVRVRYMFFPRTGPNTESWRKAEVVWCSADRNEALTRAKAGAQLDMRRPATRRRWRASTRWAKASACAARPPSSRKAATTSPATCRRGSWCSSSRSCRWRSGDIERVTTSVGVIVGRTTNGEAVVVRPTITPSHGSGRSISALQQLELVLDAFPLLGIRRRIFLLADHRPFLGQLGVQLQEALLAVRDFFLGENGLHGTLRLAQRAVDAFIRIDHQKIRTFVEAVDRDRPPRNPCICT